MYFCDMFPDEIDGVVGAPGKHRYGATAILPVGSVEQHGPALLLGCDGFISLAMSDMVAKKLEGVMFPMLPFSWIGGLRPFAGTIDMRPFVTGDYMEQVACEIFRQGFERLAIINCHGGGRELVFSVARRVYKRIHKPIITFYPTFVTDNWPEIIDLWKENGMPDSGAYEAAKLTGALYYLGDEALSDKVLVNTAEALREFGELTDSFTQPGLSSVFKLSEVGHDYIHECQHVRPKNNINRDAGIKALDFLTDKIAWGIINAE